MNRADIWEAVKDVPFTEGLCTLHFFTPLSPKKVSSVRYKLKIVQAYAPISNNKNEAVSSLYEDVESCSAGIALGVTYTGPRWTK